MCCIHSHNSWINENIILVNSHNSGPTTPEELENTVLSSPEEAHWKASKATINCSNANAVIATVALVAAIVLAVLIIIGTVVATPFIITAVPVLTTASIICIWLNRCQYQKYETQMQAIANYCGQHLYTNANENIDPPLEPTTSNNTNENTITNLLPLPASMQFSGDAQEMATKCIQHVPQEVINLFKKILGADVSKWPFVNQQPTFGAPLGIYLHSVNEPFNVWVISPTPSGQLATYHQYLNGEPTNIHTNPPSSVAQLVDMDIIDLKKQLQPWFPSITF